MPRRSPFFLLLMIVVTIVGLITFSKSFEASAALESVQRVVPSRLKGSDYFRENVQLKEAEQDYAVAELASGKPIMAKMPNQTTRAEVGRAGWKLLHTILSQYPEEPTAEEKATLDTFIKFFSRVYPCQECATHFQTLLEKFPPQLGSRRNAVMWGCRAHNVVNKRLGKDEYDCTYIFEEYDCGCGEPVPSKVPKVEVAKTEEVSVSRGG